MTNPPKISVIIPCFNHGQFLSEAIASVQATRRKDLEIIVADDGSTDEGTHRELDKIEAQGITVTRKENAGPASARNAALKLASGEYVFPLDADDRMRPSCLDLEVPILDANPKIGVVYSDGEFFGVRSGRWNVGKFDPTHLLQWNYIACCALFRRRIWEQVGGYDEHDLLRGIEDWDLWLGAFAHGWQFAYVPEVLFEYRKAHGSGLSRTFGKEGQIAELMAHKYGPLYKQYWLQLARERDSGTATIRNLRRIVKARIKHKLGLNGNHAQ